MAYTNIQYIDPAAQIAGLLDEIANKARAIKNTTSPNPNADLDAIASFAQQVGAYTTQLVQQRDALTTQANTAGAQVQALTQQLSDCKAALERKGGAPVNGQAAKKPGVQVSGAQALGMAVGALVLGGLVGGAIGHSMGQPKKKPELAEAVIETEGETIG